MSDLVERLNYRCDLINRRVGPISDRASEMIVAELREAIEEIERLRTALDTKGVQQ